MPSQATSYFYTIVAMGVVALMITNAFKIQVAGLKAFSDRQELRELLEAVATEATELIAFTEATNATAKVSLLTPTLIGDREYWIRLHSDTTEAWVEGAFGEPWAGNPDHRVELPWGVDASGTYRGGFGTLMMNCTIQGGVQTVVLARWESG
ncbi:hypothetical protein H8E65_11010 [Candidatus Bathyarchaeota archaeon]|nr:hypothetical protein [Candidatus Bathyarchaeota archaeon]MBL7079089.1 hypothetical protein [Candidatus Bathyarchaeota archaeon]